MTVSKRVDVLKKMGKKAEKNMMVKMLVSVLIHYKDNKVTTKAQRENRAEVVARLVKGLNDAGKYDLIIVADYGHGLITKKISKVLTKC